ncbi:LuxR C-terminal-related transcriptional regulator [Pseudoduganella sp. LjRoot289]|uniref:response regulator transcription factor n=1 Tax=Pseudoduganella sp. LjRoot289 TaxID=3342314 RepID=UPI003F4FEE83
MSSAGGQPCHQAVTQPGLRSAPQLAPQLVAQPNPQPAARPNPHSAAQPALQPRPRPGQQPSHMPEHRPELHLVRHGEALLPHLHLALLRLATAGPQAGSRAGERPCSRREMEILHWVGEGKSNEEVGQILGISGLTVKNHLQRIYKTLGVSNRTQAVARGMALRLLDGASSHGSGNLSGGNHGNHGSGGGSRSGAPH